ncbi:Hypothetical predicted protein [Paramuricea clavata]|uniref:Uncharacterized protein n=1 Tax=Paramuricea clavata TaxID=317549 RepID=A0A6S7KW49_PARCT|nr:Hypothetical predicted protein [Paramuricea clavata]
MLSVSDGSNPNVKAEGSPLKQFKEDPLLPRFNFALKAPTSSSKKLNEDSITYLNQGQSYQVRLKTLWDTSFISNNIVNVLVKLGFYERKLQVVEAEKYEEWLTNRPAERLLEIDIPMSVGILNIRSQGSYTNELEFEWDTQLEAQIYIKINCVSSEFTKGKSGTCMVHLK